MSTVLLLGATSDMAVAIARKMAEQGNDIQLAARNAARLASLQSDLTVRYNINCTIHEFDATDFASHSTFFESLSSKPDITICVFGYMNDNKIAEQDWQESERTISSNYTRRCINFKYCC